MNIRTSVKIAARIETLMDAASMETLASSSDTRLDNYNESLVIQ